MPRRVFISYSREDRQQVASLAEGLTRSGFDVWMDGRLDGGQDWWDEILARIRETDYFIFAVSSNSLASAACQSEYEYALALQRALLPVEVGAVASERLFDERLGRTQRAPFVAEDQASILDVVRSLLGLPDPSPPPEGVPEPDLPVSYLGRLRNTVRRSQDLNFDEQRSVASQLVDEYTKITPDDAGRMQGEEIYDLAEAMVARPDVLFSVAQHLERQIIEPHRTITGRPVPAVTPSPDEASLLERPTPPQPEPDLVDSGAVAEVPEARSADTGDTRPAADTGEAEDGGEATETESTPPPPTDPEAPPAGYRPVDDEPPRQQRRHGHVAAPARASRGGSVNRIAVVAIAAGAVYALSAIIDPLHSPPFRVWSSGQGETVLTRLVLAGALVLPGVHALRRRGDVEVRRAWEAAVGVACIVLSLDLLPFFVSGLVYSPPLLKGLLWVLRGAATVLAIGVVLIGVRRSWSARSTRLPRREALGVAVFSALSAGVGVAIVMLDPLAFPWLEPVRVHVAIVGSDPPERWIGLAALALSAAVMIALLVVVRAESDSRRRSVAAALASTALFFAMPALFHIGDVRYSYFGPDFTRNEPLRLLYAGSAALAVAALAACRFGRSPEPSSTPVEPAVSPAAIDA